MNIVILQGNLVDDVRVFTNKDGIKVVKGNIAIARNYGKKKESDYIPFTVLGNSTDYVEKYGKKGVRAVIRGSWCHSSYKDKDGNYKNSDTCLAEEINLYVDKPAIDNVKQEEEKLDIDDDDLPF